MAESGKIFAEYTHVEIDEKGQIWLIQNHFESESVILEMESSSKGEVIIDDGYLLYEDDPLDDYL